MVRTQIQFTDSQFKALRRLASEQGVSMAELVRRAVDHLMESAHAISRDELKRRSLDAVGKFRSGRTDVARKHDKHLAEIYGTWRRRS